MLAKGKVYVKAFLSPPPSSPPPLLILYTIGYVCGIVGHTLLPIQVEELAPLGDLHSRLLDIKIPFKFLLLHTYSCQLADALQYLESQRMIHRDLATRNILLVKEDSVSDECDLCVHDVFVVCVCVCRCVFVCVHGVFVVCVGVCVCVCRC